MLSVVALVACVVVVSFNHHVALAGVGLPSWTLPSWTWWGCSFPPLRLRARAPPPLPPGLVVGGYFAVALDAPPYVPLVSSARVFQSALP